MKRSRLFGLGFLTVLSAFAGTVACRSMGDRMTSAQKEGLRRDVLAWLECEECDQNELQLVLEHGADAVPTLGAVLEGGPSPANRERLRRHLEGTWDELQAYGRTHPEARIDLARDAYVAMYMENYVALYQSRAAHALGSIGSSEALRILKEFDASRVRPDVQRVLSEGLPR